MADAVDIDKLRPGEAALDGIAVAPPGDDSEKPATPEVREAKDAGDHKALQRDPSHPDSKLDIGLDESFPTSDPPATTRPGQADPAPSSGFDEESEAAIAAERAAADTEHNV